MDLTFLLVVETLCILIVKADYYSLILELRFYMFIAETSHGCCELKKMSCCWNPSKSMKSLVKNTAEILIHTETNSSLFISCLENFSYVQVFMQ